MASRVPGQPRALLWDVDGTLAETERDGHLVAFNAAFEAAGLPWRWDDARYGSLLAITGGRERLLHDLARRDDGPDDPRERERLARQLHQHKNALYAEIVASGAIALRPGVAELMAQCRDAGVAMAITTTTTRASVEALLRRHLGADWSAGFVTLVCAEDVERKKPDPAVFRIALERLGIAGRAAVAIEDSANGVLAAVAAACPVIVTRSQYFADQVISGALAIGPGLDQRAGWSPALSGSDAAGPIGLAEIAAWRLAAGLA